MTAFEWRTFDGGGLGELVRFPRLSWGDEHAGRPILLLSGLAPEDVLGPEAIRALSKLPEASASPLRVTAVPLLPELRTDGVAHDWTTPAVSGSVAARIEAELEELIAGSSALILLASPEPDVEARPWAAVPPLELFPEPAAWRRSGRLAAPFVLDPSGTGASTTVFERCAAGHGIPVLRLNAGTRRRASKTQRTELEGLLQELLAAVPASSAPDPTDRPSATQVHEVRARRSGFLHMRVQNGDRVDPEAAIAATWAYEPDLVEEHRLPGGIVFEARHAGRVTAGDLIARSHTD